MHGRLARACHSATSRRVGRPLPGREDRTTSDHATPIALAADAIERAAVTLRDWALAPQFTDWEDGTAPDLDVGDLDRRR